MAFVNLYFPGAATLDDEAQRVLLAMRKGGIKELSHATASASNFSVAAEESYWRDHPFRANDLQGDRPGSDGINSTTHWWTRKGIGAQTINLFCRQGIAAARALATRVLQEMREDPTYQYTWRHDMAFAQISDDLKSDALDTHDGLFEKRLQHVVRCLHTYTTLGRIRVQALQAVTIRRAPRTHVMVGATITDWINQFVSVTPHAKEEGMFEPTMIGNGELQGDYYELVWPKGVTTVCGWYLGPLEMVLPMGCTFKILKKLPGEGHWQALVCMPGTYHRASPHQALTLPPTTLLRAADITATSLLGAHNPDPASRLPDVTPLLAMGAPMAVATAKATIEDCVFREMTSKRDTWQYTYSEITPSDVTEEVKGFRSLMYANADLRQYPYKAIRQLVQYYYHIEHLVDVDTCVERINHYNAKYLGADYSALAPVGEADKYAVMRRRLWQVFSSTPSVIEPTIERMKQQWPREDNDSINAFSIASQHANSK